MIQFKFPNKLAITFFFVFLFSTSTILYFSLYTTKPLIPTATITTTSTTTTTTDHILINPTSLSDQKNVSITILSGGIRTTSEETPLLIKSILLHRTTPLELNIATDEESKQFLMKNIFDRLNNAGGVYPSLTVNFKIVNLEETKQKCEDLQFPIVHHSGAWGMTKLFLDEIFEETDKSIFVDTDMVFGSDPALLFSDFDKFAQETVFAWTREKDWEERGPNTICSCIFLWDMKKSREMKLIKTKARDAAIKAFGFDEKTQKVSTKDRNGGDQDFLFALAKIYPNMFNELHEAWNLANCQNFFGVPSRSVTTDKTMNFIGTLHFNCIKGNKYDDWKGWDWVKDYLTYYRWEFLSRQYDFYKLSKPISIN